MRISKTSLIVYFFCCILATISSIFDYNALLLVSFPLIIPSLSFYYFINTKKINYLLCLYLFFNFVGDSVGLMNFKDEIYYILIPFFLGNIILIIILMQHFEKFKFKVINVISIIIVVGILIFLWNSIMDIFYFYEDGLRLRIFIFAIPMFLVTFLASYNLIWRINYANLFLFMAISCLLISDMFYVIYNFQIQVYILNVLHFIAQILSYFFIVKYILLREDLKKIIYEK